MTSKDYNKRGMNVKEISLLAFHFFRMPTTLSLVLSAHAGGMNTGSAF